MVGKFKAPIKVKSTTVEEHDKMLKEFTEMLEAWKFKKEGRDYEIKDNREELMIEITGILK